MVLEADIHRFVSAILWPLVPAGLAAILYLGIAAQAVLRRRALDDLLRRVTELRRRQEELRKTGGADPRLANLAPLEEALRKMLEKEAPRALPAPPPKPRA